MILPILKFYADELNKHAEGIPNNRSNATEETKWILPDMYQGLLVSLFYLCYGTSSIFSGQFANKYGRRPVILAGLIGMSTGLRNKLLVSSGRAMLCGNLRANCRCLPSLHQ